MNEIFLIFLQKYTHTRSRLYIYIHILQIDGLAIGCTFGQLTSWRHIKCSLKTHVIKYFWFVFQLCYDKIVWFRLTLKYFHLVVCGARRISLLHDPSVYLRIFIASYDSATRSHFNPRLSQSEQRLNTDRMTG